MRDAYLPFILDSRPSTFDFRPLIYNLQLSIVPGKVLAQPDKALAQAAAPAKFVGGAMGGPGGFFRYTRFEIFGVTLENI
jgi:hypothetical protein